MLTEGNPFSGVTTGVEENQFTLLLNEAGDAVFNLNTSDIQQVVQRKERDTSTNTATNVTVHAGYDLYTRNSAGDVQRFSFGTDGRLQGSPTSLDGTDLLQEEALTRLDLSGSNTVGTTIRERLVTGVAATASDGGARSLYQSDDGLLISTSIDLTQGSDFSSTAAGSSGTYTDELPALFLKGNGNAFSIDAGKKAIHTQRLTALNSDGTDRTDGYRLYLATDDTNVSTLAMTHRFTVEFNAAVRLFKSNNNSAAKSWLKPSSTIALI